MGRFAGLGLAALLAVSPAQAAGESVRSVLVTRFVGLPADSAARSEFMAAFRAEMDAEAWPCEVGGGEAWEAPRLRTNFFRIMDAAPADQSWVMDVSVRVPPEVRVTRKAIPNSKLPPPRARVSHVRSSRGLTIAVSVTSPSSSATGAVTSDPAIYSVYFADARRVVVPSPKLPAGGYDYPWADAGRTVARAALETLHRASGGLQANERAALAPATRVVPTGAEAMP